LLHAHRIVFWRTIYLGHIHLLNIRITNRKSCVTLSGTVI